jgi:hypothetical protein
MVEDKQRIYKTASQATVSLPYRHRRMNNNHNHNHTAQAEQEQNMGLFIHPIIRHLCTR